MCAGGSCDRAVFLTPERVSFLSREQAEEKLDAACHQLKTAGKPETCGNTRQLERYTFVPCKEGYCTATNTDFLPLRLQDGYILTGDARFPLLSNPHFELRLTKDGAGKEALLLDHSLNGVYCNGSRVQTSAVLQEGDWIFAGGLSFVYYDDLLLLPPELIHTANPYAFFAMLSDRQRVQAGKGYLLEAFHQEKVRIEAPVSEQTESAASGGSPGAMMAISALASMLSGFLLNPGDIKTVLSSACASGISALAFMLWYGRQNQKSRKANKNRADQTMSAYLNYLEETASSLDAKRQKRNEIFFAQEKTVSALDSSWRFAMAKEAGNENWKLPVGIWFETFVQIELPLLGWQLENERARKALESLANMNLRAPLWQVFEQGSRWTLQDPSPLFLDDLFLLWAWMVWNPKRRFVLCAMKPAGSVWKHPALWLEETYLCFEDRESLLAFVFSHPKIEWTVLSRQPLSLGELPTGSSLIQIACTDTKEKPPSGSPGVFEQPARIRLMLSDAERKQKARAASFGLPSDKKAPACRPACLEQGIRRGIPVCMRIDLAPGVSWDLCQEGPHALIAGSTGSGKSEGLCGALFQLAWLNSPAQVQFLLIDFKGGAFGAPLKDLPHTAGYMTNLQSGSILRMERALKAELDRRQDLISAYLADHPGAAPSIEGCPELGLSHILICVDEFGQLKDRAPEFMKSLQESARIGRSLGVHLILSTQKPAGLVDEQIWANSRSRLCFGVLDPADSREVLGHEGASLLKEPGEFILQVSGRPDKKGRAWYLKACADGRSEIDIYDEQNRWQRLERECLQDRMRQEILQLEEKRSWILAPDPLTSAKESSRLVIDRINGCQRMNADCSSMALLGSKGAVEHVITLLLHDEKRRICSSFVHPCADQIIDPAALSSAQLMEEDTVVLLDDLSLLEDAQIDFLLESETVTLILAADQISYSLENWMGRFEARLFLDLDSREQKSAFFGGKNVAEQTYPAISAWIRQKEERLIAGKMSPPITRVKRAAFLPECRLSLGRKDILHCDGPLFLGIFQDGRKPHFYRSQPITFVYSTQSGNRMAHSLFLRLHAFEPMLLPAAQPGSGRIAFADLSECDEMESASRLQAILQQGEMIFFGKGMESLACMVGLSLPFDRSGNALFCQEETLYDFLAASLEES